MIKKQEYLDQETAKIPQRIINMKSFLINNLRSGGIVKADILGINLEELNIISGRWCVCGQMNWKIGGSSGDRWSEEAGISIPVDIVRDGIGSFVKYGREITEHAKVMLKHFKKEVKEGKYDT